MQYGSSPINLSQYASASSGLSPYFQLISGPATLSGNTLTITGAGTVAITAYQDGNSTFASAPPVTQNIVVSQAPQAITFAALTSPVTYGISPITLSATGGASGEPVVFSVVSGPGTVSGNVLTITGVGTVVVAANQAGSTNYTAASQVTQSVVVTQAATLISPTSGSVLGGSTATFSWNPGNGATAYELWLGSTGGGSSNLYNSGSVTGTSATVSGLPTNGGEIYITLFSEISGNWQSVHYTAIGAGTPAQATLASPQPGSTLSGATATFTWTSGTGVTAYWLYLGTTGARSENVYSSGLLSSTSEVVSGIPADGVTIYVTLYSEIDGNWQPADYVFTEAGTYSLAAMTSPASGSTLPGSSVTFSWSAGAGPTAYWLYLGTWGAQSANLYNSGSLTGTSVAVSGLPTFGETIYATLFSEIDGAWQPVGYTYTESGSYTLAALTSPTPGSALPGSSVTFSWTAGVGVPAYWLYLGTIGPGTANLYSSGSLSGTSVSVGGLPTNGETIYATLFSYIDNSWQPVNYTYTAQ